MDPFTNPDLTRYILSYSDRLPKYAAVNSVFANVSEDIVREQVQYMDKYYPLWNISIADIEQINPDVSRIIAEMRLAKVIDYHLQRAAINKDWDVFRVMVEYHFRNKEYPGLIDTAIHVAHLNGNRELAMRLYRQYRTDTRLQPVDGIRGATLYYALINNPSFAEKLINTPRRIPYYINNLIPPVLREIARGDTPLSERLRQKVDQEDFPVLSNNFESELFEDLVADEYLRLMMQYVAANPDIPYDQLIFSFQYDVINNIQDPAKRAEIRRDWISDIDNYLYEAEDVYYNAYMINELNALLSKPSLTTLRDKLVETPILLKGSSEVWKSYENLIRIGQADPSLAMKIAYLQRIGQPVTLESLSLQSV